MKWLDDLIKRLHKCKFETEVNPLYGNSICDYFGCGLRVDFYDPPTYYQSVYLKFYRCRCGKITVVAKRDFDRAYKYSSWFRNIWAAKKIMEKI